MKRVCRIALVVLNWGEELTRLVPVWSRNSCGCPMVELQVAPEAFAASHGTGSADLLARKEEEVVLPLVVPLSVEVRGVGS